MAKNLSAERIVVTIDGPAASGKSTIGIRLAQRLGYRYVNSGELYRALAWASLRAERNGISLPQYLKNCEIELKPDGGLMVDGTLLTSAERERDLHTSEISSRTSKISALPEVREKLYNAQRTAYEGHNIVTDGRDMGTVVFPEAQHKFFVNAKLEIRAQRRQVKTPQVPLEVILGEIAKRDKNDTERAIAPTVPARDAILIQNDGDNPDSVVEHMVKLIT